MLRFGFLLGAVAAVGADHPGGGRGRLLPGDLRLRRAVPDRGAADLRATARRRAADDLRCPHHPGGVDRGHHRRVALAVWPGTAIVATVWRSRSSAGKRASSDQRRPGQEPVDQPTSGTGSTCCGTCCSPPRGHPDRDRPQRPDHCPSGPASSSSATVIILLVAHWLVVARHPEWWERRLGRADRLLGWWCADWSRCSPPQHQSFVITLYGLVPADVPDARLVGNGARSSASRPWSAGRWAAGVPVRP